MSDEGEFEVFQRLPLDSQLRLLNALLAEPEVGPRVRLGSEQRRMLLLEQTDATKMGYTVSSAWRLDGPLDRTRFRLAVETVVNREWSLRQRYVNMGGDCFQLFSSAPLRMEFGRVSETELAGLLSESLDQSSMNFHTGGPIRPFDEPVIRLRLLSTTDEAKHLFTMSVHHMAVDGASQSMLMNRIEAQYNSAEEQPSEFLDRSFARHLFAQEAYLESDEFRSDATYWRSEVEGIHGPVTLPPVLDGGKGEAYHRQVFELTPPAVERLSQLASGEQATMVHAVLGAYYLMLSRYSGTTDIAIGMPVDTRSHRDLRDTIGNFVNTLAIRVHTPATNFRALMRGVRDTSNQALMHRKFPFDKVSTLAGTGGRPERGGALCSTFLSVEPYAMAQLDLNEVECIDIAPSGTSAPWGDIAFYVQLTSSGAARCELVVAPDVLDEALVGAAAAHLEGLLHVIPDEADAPLGRLLVNSAESAAAGADVEYDKRPATHFFEQAARRSPDAIAVQDSEGVITYGEMWSLARQAARGLIDEGVRPGDAVAVAATRDRWFVLGMYAVLLAGGVYMPVGTEVPDRRLREMVEASGARVLLLPSATEFEMPDLPSIALKSLIQLERADELPLLSLDDAAYVVFTSGSTGTPKAVLNSHRSLTAFVAWCTDAYTSSELACVLGSTHPTFDISLFELFAPLAVGGRLLIVDDLFALQSINSAAEVTLINTVPSLMKEYLNDWRLPDRVQTVNFCGETLPNAVAQSVYARGGGVERVYNLYGPSEDTVFSTVWSVPRGWVGALPIGKPLHNSVSYVRSAKGEPVPIGAPGELVLAGDCVAIGYQGRPRETAHRFRPSEMGVGRRSYRTGDLVRMHPDGDLEFLGREDRQIKLRGLRIEPGDVEAATQEMEGVSNCAVVATQLNGTAVLAAYVTSDSGTDVDIEGLIKTHLSSRLPAYMIPSHVVRVAAIPLTNSGKLDVRALPPLVVRTGSRRPPQGVLEEAVCQLFADALGRQDIGVDDDFFAMGGTSLAALRLTSRLRQLVGRDVSAASLFNAPTPAELAVEIRRSALGEAAELRLIKNGDGPALVCLPPGGGEILVYSSLAAHLDWAGPIYGVTAPGLNDGRTMIQSVEDAADRAILELSRAGIKEVGALLGFCFGGTVAAAMAKRLQDQDERVPKVVVISGDRTGDFIDMTTIDPIEEFGTSLAEAAGVHDVPSSATHPTVTELVDWARERGIVDDDEDALGDMRRRFDVWCNNLNALARYHPTTTALDTRGLCIQADQMEYDSSQQWTSAFGQGSTVVRVSCGHEDTMRPPHVQEVASHVSAWLGGSQATDVS